MRVFGLFYALRRKWLYFAVVLPCLSNAQTMPDILPPLPSPATISPSALVTTASRTHTPAFYGMSPSLGTNTANSAELLRQQTDLLIQQDIQQKKQSVVQTHYLESTISYDLPQSQGVGVDAYKSAFDRLGKMEGTDYSVRDANFLVENAYFDQSQSDAEFQDVIRRTGDFLKSKMAELKYDADSNLAKNYILFQFFSEPMKDRATGRKHLPFTYDFNDYMGRDDWSKMFVTKLLATHSGQCHSLPLLYLILAEEIGAKASLAVSPNHYYIKFQDDAGKWYNIELTNAMFTSNSFILDNGYIKAEALQNKIYMQPLDKKQLLSQFYADLAAGYLHKYGYDGFFAKAVIKALDLYPENVTANMLLANYNTFRFEYLMRQYGINPEKREELQRIKSDPRAVELLLATKQQYRRLDDLGYEFMPKEAYEQWLRSMQAEKQKQVSDALKAQFKGVLKQNIRD